MSLKAEDYGGTEVNWRDPEPEEGLEVLMNLYGPNIGKVFAVSSEFTAYKVTSPSPKLQGYQSWERILPGTLFVLCNAAVGQTSSFMPHYMLFDILVGSELYFFSRDYNEFRLWQDMDTGNWSIGSFINRVQ